MNRSAAIIKDIHRAYDAHSGIVYRLSLSTLQHSADAEDAVQDVFIKYMSSAPDIFQNEEHERAWLVRTATNHCRDLLRKRKLRTHASIDDLDHLAENSEADREGAYDVLKSLSSIPEKYRAAVSLHYLEGASIEQTASMLGISPAAVKMRLMRARKLLKEELTGEGYDV